MNLEAVLSHSLVHYISRNWSSAWEVNTINLKCGTFHVHSSSSQFASVTFILIILFLQIILTKRYCTSSKANQGINGYPFPSIEEKPFFLLPYLQKVSFYDPDSVRSNLEYLWQCRSLGWHMNLKMITEWQMLEPHKWIPRLNWPCQNTVQLSFLT